MGRSEWAEKWFQTISNSHDNQGHISSSVKPTGGLIKILWGVRFATLLEGHGRLWNHLLSNLYRDSCVTGLELPRVSKVSWPQIMSRGTQQWLQCKKCNISFHHILMHFEMLLQGRVKFWLQIPQILKSKIQDRNEKSLAQSRQTKWVCLKVGFKVTNCSQL